MGRPLAAAGIPCMSPGDWLAMPARAGTRPRIPGWVGRQKWWIGATVASFVATGLGRLLDPAWLYGNFVSCDPWFGLGQAVLMGDTAHSLFPYVRQTARVADFALSGVLYRGLDVGTAQFLVATFWLAVTVVALSAAARRAVGPWAYGVVLAVGLLFWPLYPAMSTDYSPRSTVAWIAVAIFGIVLAVARPLSGAVIVGFGLTLAGFTEPVVFPVALGAVCGLGVVLFARSRGGRSYVRSVATGITGCVAGAVAALSLLVILGNTTGSEPGFMAVTVTWDQTLRYMHATAEYKALWYTPLTSLLSVWPTLGLVLLLTAPGAATLVVALFRRSWKQSIGACAMHVTATVGVGTAVLLQGVARMMVFTGGDWYQWWYVPPALVSFAVVVGPVLAGLARERRLLPIGIVAGSLVAAAWLWLAPVGQLGPTALVALAALTFMVMMIAQDRRTVVALAAVSLLTIALVRPNGMGDLAWGLRDDPPVTTENFVQMQEAVVAALGVVPAVSTGGPVIWWLSDPADPAQFLLQRGTLQCELRYPSRIDRPLSAPGQDTYAGYFVGAPARLAVPSSFTGSPRPSGTLSVPDGQGLIAVFPASSSVATARAGVRRTLARQGLGATLKASVRLPGGQLVLGWAISCASGDQCRIRYRPPPR